MVFLWFSYVRAIQLYKLGNPHDHGTVEPPQRMVQESCASSEEEAAQARRLMADRMLGPGALISCGYSNAIAINLGRL